MKDGKEDELKEAKELFKEGLKKNFQATKKVSEKVVEGFREGYAKDVIVLQMTWHFVARLAQLVKKGKKNSSKSDNMSLSGLLVKSFGFELQPI